MIASLPMYMTPLTEAAYHRFWAAIRKHLARAGLDAPEEISTGTTDLLAHWRDPSLLLSQTCSLPYRAKLKDHVSLVGTPDYGLPDCPAGHYNSVILVRDASHVGDLSDLRGQRFAYNDALSQSGWAAVALERPDILGGAHMCTGSHRASAQAVSDGLADFAALDHVTWRLLRAEDRFRDLSVIHTTTPTPALPFITAQHAHVDTIRNALNGAIGTLSEADRQILMIQGLTDISTAAYALPLPPSPEAINA
ncbi:phosphate/phosphite/phosphonate ABC transporter substrate-binding protein [Yoonia litorea]|uniref:ABC-type phosphate/phosphonate transport system, substrate-binding protein n=1 Tax=Yoonia litorea TaxID=1123755 RepID=A0A1I6MH01_9RHOB|nr:PhnD/SsuA/transferrin family substrate-binding protein [Yoonia litorea]SFS14922.1 ABC-type phosphate/phosphonate transport system, substrate-binding protein [Yoonia litorea]